MTKDIIEELHGAADRAGLVCTKTGNFRAAMIDSAHLRKAAAEIEQLRAERDEVRQSYCSLMEAYRGGDGRVTANKLGWGYLFEDDKPCQ